MSRKITLAVLQTALSDDAAKNISRVSDLVRQAAAKGADVILPSELFEGHYFCKTQDEKHFTRAHAWRSDPGVIAMAKLAKELGVVIPVSIFEKAGPAYYNSMVMVDADGSALGVYRKSHIPDGPGYQEKYYFRPGDTGFRAWKTKHGVIGVGICWDQWYPEAARAMVLQGAELLLYPTAIGSEPYDLTLDTHKQWQRAMQGHAVANAVPVVAANRVGREENDGASQTYYGHSFMADHVGEIVASFGAKEEGVLIGSFDLAAIERYRAEWGFFRDRRTDLYAKSLL